MAADAAQPGGEWVGGPASRLTRDAMAGFATDPDGLRPSGPLRRSSRIRHPRIGSPGRCLDASRRPWTFVEGSRARADQRPMGSTRDTQRVRVRTPGRGVMFVYAVALAVVTGVALLTVNDANWKVAE